MDMIDPPRPIFDRMDMISECGLGGEHHRDAEAQSFFGERRRKKPKTAVAVFVWAEGGCLRLKEPESGPQIAQIYFFGENERKRAKTERSIG